MIPTPEGLPWFNKNWKLWLTWEYDMSGFLFFAFLNLRNELGEYNDILLTGMTCSEYVSSEGRRKQLFLEGNCVKFKPMTWTAGV